MIMDNKFGLSKEELTTINYFVAYGKFGEALQDLYLKDFFDYMSNISHPNGMEMPAIVCDPHNFRFTHNNNNAYYPGDYLPEKNTRTIIDMVNADPALRNEVHVFFDYPDIHSSPLYFGTFNANLRSVITHALEEMRANYKVTPIGEIPFTAKVDMASFATGRFSRNHVMQSLKYKRDLNSIYVPAELFDVIDTEPESRF